MNATPLNLNPLQSAPTPSPSGKQADDAEVPFSQVLSGEMAQARKSDPAKPPANDAPDAQAAAAAAASSDSPADAPTAAAKPARAAGDDSRDPRDGVVPEDAAALLALAMNPEAFKPAGAAATTGDPQAAAPAAGATGVPVATGVPGAVAVAASAPDGRASPVLVAGQAAAQATPMPRTQHAAQPAARAADARAAGKPEPLSAATTDTPAARPSGAGGEAAAATAFTERLAAALQAERARPDGVPADLAANPALRAAVHGALASHAAPADAASPRLAPPVGTQAWSQALGDKLVWMVGGQQQTASLTLNPPNLGPLQVVLNVSNDQATASFFSAQPEVRHALEAAFPRLREMMSDAGITLGQATVSADTPQQNDTPDRQAPAVAAPFPAAGAGADVAVPTVQMPARSAGRGLVDTFA